MPLADVEGSPSLKFFTSRSCLSTPATSPCSLSSCLRTDATYCAFAGLEDAGFGLFLGSPTTATAPFAPERFSLVKPFFVFFVSAGGAAPYAPATLAHALSPSHHSQDRK